MEKIPNHQAVLYESIHTFSYTEAHTHPMCMYTYSAMREKENERSVLCHTVQCWNNKKQAWTKGEGFN